jgi:formylglycine-generating enzyme required for sulfatase activity
MVRIPGGTFTMGTDEGFPFEGPAHRVTLKPFLLDRTEVTVAEFARFVRAARYKTEAERYRWSGVLLCDGKGWRKVDGADWRHPEGPKSRAKPSEPVVHVSWNDARAYAKWAGKRLPTEAEFELAIRNGMEGKLYPWGDEFIAGAKHVANLWQGEFPRENLALDGFKERAPAGRFPANAYGLRDIVGNVWEWCSDAFDPDYYSVSPANNPKGPAKGGERVIRGGSWMCSENYCQGYRSAARSHSAPDSGLNNLGFRCAKDLP